MSQVASSRELPASRGFLAALLGVALAVVFAATAPKGIFLAIGAAAVCMAVLSPWWGTLFAAALPLALHADFINQYKLPFFGFSLYPPDVVALLLLGALVMFHLTGARYGRSARPSALLSTFLLYAYLMGVVALFRGLDRREVLADVRPFAQYAVALLVPTMLCSRERLRTLLWVLLAASAAGSAYGVFHSLSNPGLVVYSLSLGFARLTGGSEGTYAPMACFGIAVLALSRSRGLRAMALVQVPLAAAATVLTYSRGSWLALIGGLVVVVGGVALRNPKRVASVLGSIAAMSALVFGWLVWRGIPLGEAVAARSSAAGAGRVDLAVVQRLLEYQQVASAFLANPFFGAGPGTLFHYFMPGRGWMTTSFTHNSFFYIASKWGGIGIALFLGFFALFLLRAVPALRRAVLEDRAVALLALSSALVALGIKALSTWFLNEYTVSLWVGVMFGALDWMGRADRDLPPELR